MNAISNHLGSYGEGHDIVHGIVHGIVIYYRRIEDNLVVQNFIFSWLRKNIQKEGWFTPIFW